VPLPSFNMPSEASPAPSLLILFWQYLYHFKRTGHGYAISPVQGRRILPSRVKAVGAIIMRKVVGAVRSLCATERRMVALDSNVIPYE
jgi:hypothetical protein